MAKVAVLNNEYSFNFDDGWLYKGTDKIVSITGREADLLMCLCDNPNKYLSLDLISDLIWEMDYMRGRGSRVEDSEFKYFSRETIKPWKSNLLKKHEIFSSVIGSTRGKGYIYNGKPIAEMDIGTDYSDDGRLHHELTDKSFIVSSREKILYRANECQEVIEALNNNRSVVLSGMGGTGKTSVARLVYSNLKGEYECCGWINYNIDLKHSMISAINLDEYSDETVTENDVQKKWNYIVKRLANNKQSKLIVIDNVDYVEGVQSPIDDEELRLISGWDNIKIIITSRMPEIPGFGKTIQISNLGDSSNCDKCVELFYHYNPDAAEDRENNKDVVGKLCELAGYNTMVIELIAKDCRYDTEELEEYYQKLKNNGFSCANEVPIETDHDYNTSVTKASDGSVDYEYYNRGNETMASQLMKLFNMKQRGQIEKQILWDFHCLPEAERITKTELKNWLGYSLMEITRLVDESWIKCVGGFFYMHPLISQAISCADEEWEYYWNQGEKRRENNNDTLVSLIKNKELFKPEDGFGMSIRKIMFADYLSYGGRFLEADNLMYIADFARKRGVRDIGKRYYKKAYNKLYCKASEIGCIDDQNCLGTLTEAQLNIAKQFWKCTYYYGYMLSYTRSGYDESEIYMALAAKVINMITDNLSEEEAYDLKGMSFDHYGYVKSNNHKNELNNFINACMLYRIAIEYREKLVKQFPDNLSYYRDLAWSYDNLGTLFAIVEYDKIIGEKGSDEDLCVKVDSELYSYENEYDFFMNSEKEAEGYLVQALKMRRELASIRGDEHSTEVAWTCCNMASLLSKYPERHVDAEKYIMDALKIYEELDKEFPEQHSSSIARTYVAYGKLLAKWDGRKDDALKAYMQALEINNNLEKDYPGVYIKEIENIEKKLKELVRVQTSYS